MTKPFKLTPRRLQVLSVLENGSRFYGVHYKPAIALMAAGYIEMNPVRVGWYRITIDGEVALKKARAEQP